LRFWHAKYVGGKVAAGSSEQSGPACNGIDIPNDIQRYRAASPSGNGIIAYSRTRQAENFGSQLT
jgi:hypothetical protein